MRWIKYIGVFSFGLYVSLGIALYFFQQKIFLHPQVLPSDYRFDVGREVNILSEDGTAINTLWIQGAHPKGVILYLHGNKGSIRRAIYQTRMMQGLDCDLVLMDYRGFGKVHGPLNSDEDFFADVEAVYKKLLSVYEEDEIFVLGYSLGCAPASWLGAHHDPGHIFLVAPFYSMLAMKDEYLPVFPDFLVRFPFENARWLSETKEPVTIFHGREDDLIPYAQAQALEDIGQNIRLIPVENAGHRRVIFSDKIREALMEKLR